MNFSERKLLAQTEWMESAREEKIRLKEGRKSRKKGTKETFQAKGQDTDRNFFYFFPFN